MSEVWVFGLHAVTEALEHPERVRQVWFCRAAGGATDRIEEAAKKSGAKVKSVPRSALERVLEPGARHQGVAAELLRTEFLSLEGLLSNLPELPLLVLLDGIEDPGNLGAILRSAYALGADGVVLPKDRSAPLNGVAIKRSAGAALRIPIAQVTNLKHALQPLQQSGVWTAAAVMEGTPIGQVDCTVPLAVVVGAEGKGVRPSLSKRCDFQVSIPMARGFDSLNASVATGIFLFEVGRQRLGQKS